MQIIVLLAVRQFIPLQSMLYRSPPSVVRLRLVSTQPGTSILPRQACQTMSGQFQQVEPSQQEEEPAIIRLPSPGLQPELKRSVFPIPMEQVVLMLPQPFIRLP